MVTVVGAVAVEEETHAFVQVLEAEERADALVQRMFVADQASTFRLRAKTTAPAPAATNTAPPMASGATLAAPVKASTPESVPDVVGELDPAATPPTAAAGGTTEKEAEAEWRDVCPVTVTV